MMHTGAVEPSALSGRAAAMKTAPMPSTASKVGIPAPEYDNPVALQGAELLRRAERDRTPTNDDHHGIVGLGHGRFLRPPDRKGRRAGPRHRLRRSTHLPPLLRKPRRGQSAPCRSRREYR